MKPKKNDLKPVKPKKSRWKAILIALLILGALSTCAAPTAEQDKPRGTLPSASVSGQVKTQPPASEPAPKPEPESTPAPVPAPTPGPVGTSYMLNTNTHKFHYLSCSSVNQMNPAHKRPYTGTRETNRTSDPSLRSETVAVNCHAPQYPYVLLCAKQPSCGNK